jgi:hypothetical protein
VPSTLRAEKAESVEAILTYYPNMGAFAVLDPDGSITAWGGSNYGGVNPPTGGGYTKIYSAGSAFAALAFTVCFTPSCDCTINSKGGKSGKR